MLESTLITQLATQEASITGVTKSYGFAENPESIPAASLPAVVHFAPSFTAADEATSIVFRNVVTIRSRLLVTPRTDLPSDENKAVVFGSRWRATFNSKATRSTICSAASAVQFRLVSGEYGIVEYAGQEYFGWDFVFEAIEVA